MCLQWGTLPLYSASGESPAAESRLIKTPNHSTCLGSSCLAYGTSFLHSDWKKRCLAALSASASFRVSCHLSFLWAIQLQQFSFLLRLSVQFIKKARASKTQAFHLETPFQRICLFSLAAYFLGPWGMYGPPLATVWQHCRIFDSVLRSNWLTDYIKTAMCWSHHFPGSPDDEKDPVFCSCYTLVSPCFYFHRYYSIPVTFFLLKPDFYFKYSFTTVRA